MPSAVSPIRLLSTVLPVEAAPVIRTPSPEFEEMALPQVESGPPITLPAEFSIRTPSPPLPGLPVPKTYPPPGARPIRLAPTMVRVAARSDDLNAVAAIAGDHVGRRSPDPPIALLEPSTSTPSAPLPT